jgi:hypothetical protein
MAERSRSHAQTHQDEHNRTASRAERAWRRWLGDRRPASGAAVINAQKGVVLLRHMPSCRPADIAAVAVVRAGVTRAELATLTPRPLAVLPDVHTGELAFLHAAAVPATADAATFRRSYQMVPADPALQSCDYMLRDRPAAQPFVQAAMRAAVARGLVTSASSLRARLAVTEIGDNPLASGSLVVVLLLDGAPVGSVAGHIIYGPYQSVFAVLDRASMQVTGVGSGTW